MPRGGRLKEWLITFMVLAGIAFGIAVAAREPANLQDKAGFDTSSVYWSDGDSGQLADGTKFRLHGVDAPETGAVDWYTGAKCEGERELGYEAKAYVRTLTRDKVLTVSHSYGADRYGRQVVDLSVDGQDLAALLVAAGTHKVWDYDGGAAKPNWCTGRTQQPVTGS
ncbi:MAG: thermonuclease family protein [Rhodobacterales bacterium]|nr:thermonuclease family protein [Rhodobacterales bacterium]